MTFDVPLLVPGIRLDRDAAAESRRALARARHPWVAGFLVFGGEAAQVARLTADLRAAAGRPIFIASDMERGAGQQVAGLTQLPDAGLVGLGGTPEESWALGLLTSREARSVGIDVIFAPCVDVRSEMDNPILGNRAYGYDPHRVAVLGAAFAAGVLAGGALPVAKHFPGHGATREDSHDALPVVHADEATLVLRDLVPFARLLGPGGCPGLMTAHVAYPALDPSGVIATFSQPIVDRARAMAEPGASPTLVFTDALLMAGALVDGSEAEAARRSLRAGCDALLYPDDPEAVAAALALRDGELEPHVRRAAAHVEVFLGRAAQARAAADPPRDDPRPGAAQRVARRAVELALGGHPWSGPSGVVVIDDDGIEGRGRVLAAAAAQEQTPCALLRVSGEEGGGRYDLPPHVAGGLWLVVVFASARAWKGASGVSPACRETVGRVTRWIEEDRKGHVGVIWCTPRPDGRAGAHLPGSGPHLEAALAASIWPAARPRAGEVPAFQDGDPAVGD